ncbi:pyridoxal phosphate-dependent aminotransferase [Pigmentiphaga sp.]|jgi:Aspartate/tyrosine/aromatic aminotransferase|uniref:pyridoxal phosphate-dependent aminotransferase n=1 Tax=Pigmentiphaga sp. TaxID=1977564 RepID=UPI0025E2E91A|nr:pyridoxal phosphate-dependent aminotransferase [Pigmentiphaga sp.]MBX6319241.1 pyridoxal phosphate-dependent aminotransferase [Pigmentiphaga sp.]
MINSKLPDVGVTIFTVMSRLATETRAINLGQGFPDFDPDAGLLEKVAAAMSAGHNQYAPMAGVPELRRAISAKTQRLYGAAYDPETEITVTSGATQALMTAILASAGAGDEVIVLEPTYDSYVPAIKLAGATPIAVQLLAPTPQAPGYRPDWEAVKRAITPRTRALVINFPHNPTGAVLNDADLDELERILASTGIVLISDEVYEHIVFDGRQHASVARRPALASRSFLISSFGKTFHTTGWKIGYCCAPAPLSQEFRKIHQFMVFAVSTPMQYGLAAFLEDPRHYLDLPAFYQAKRDRLEAGLRQTRFKPLPCPGTYFLLADYSEISDAPESEFARWLTTEHGVAVIPIAAFHADPQAPSSNRQLVRFCFAKKDTTLDAALERLQEI